MNVRGEPKEPAVSREIMPADGSNPACAMNGDFGTSPPNGGRPSDEAAQLISHQRAWQRVRIAVIFPSNAAAPLPCFTMFLPAPAPIPSPPTSPPHLPPS